jgi:hypothetical protein
MIKPSEIQAPTNDLTAADLDKLTELERQFDAAIREASNTGRWPAIVRNDRDGISSTLTARTAEKYRAAGWRVTQTAQHRAEILHPEAKV